MSFSIITPRLMYAVPIIETKKQELSRMRYREFHLALTTASRVRNGLAEAERLGDEIHSEVEFPDGLEPMDMFTWSDCKAWLSTGPRLQAKGNMLVPT